MASSVDFLILLVGTPLFILSVVVMFHISEG